ncbi:uncharacterized protein LOC141693794 [Apium graveolens]|uniref:uncharacterized protein LOC141693794 n=1 Tax=Apium graveolens TaxID=4045 RepID=UPI003D79B298
MSRKGYANLEKEWSEDHPDEEEVDRSSTWVLARMDKDGNFLSDAIAEKAKEIAKLKEDVKEGKLKVEGVNDVLTMSLGNPEHGGRVRGQGTHVKQSVYFDLPRKRKSKSMDEKIREKVQKCIAEETAKIIEQRDTFWAGEFEKLRARTSTKHVHQDCSPKPASQQASCHSNGGVDVDVGVKNLDTPETVRKIFHVQEDEGVYKVQMIDALFVDFGEELKASNKVAGEDENCRFVENEIYDEVKVNASSSVVCKLAIGSLSNIIAYAKTDEVIAPEGCEEKIHGVILGEDNVRVSITQVIQGDAKVPFPIGDEIVTVEQAIGTLIAWPQNLIAIGNNSPSDVLSAPKKAKKGHSKKMKKTYKVVEDVEP